ncbi:MAG: GNAT family N-acetyltransferase [Bacteroidetes bacterium]|nr:GNAT family N-acetyltransferase [Bacteroidota bacterium]
MVKISEEILKKKIIVRKLKLDDYESLVELQLSCFPGMKPWSKKQFESQITIFPDGQIGIECDNKLIASSTSLIIDFDFFGEKHSWKEISDAGYIRNHSYDGDTLYGIEIMVHPDYRGMKLARRLYDARKKLAQELNLMRIVIGGRIPGYAEVEERMTAREYVDKVMKKVIFDPVLTTQLANGFVLKRIIKNYLDSDKQSVGYATFLEWPNLDYEPDPSKRYNSAKPVRVCAVQYQMRMIHNFEEFGTQCEYFVDVASNYKSDFVLFPEIFTTQLLSFIDAKRPGIAARKLAEYTPQYIELFSNLAIKYNINIVGGSQFVLENERLFNVAFLFQRNGEIGKQYKIHITPNERRWWGVEPGDKIEVFETDKGKVAIQICYDVEFPELARIVAEKGAQIIFVPFCTDERKGYLRVRYCAQARCIENHVYTVLAGTVGNLPDVENMDVQYAQSGIYTPSDFEFARDGIAAECQPNIETVVIHDIDLEVVKRHKKTGTTLNWQDRRLDLYELKLLKQ